MPSRGALRTASAPLPADVWNDLPYAPEGRLIHDTQLETTQTRGHGPGFIHESTSQCSASSTSSCSVHDELVPQGGWLWDTPPGSMLQAAKDAGKRPRRLLNNSIMFGGASGHECSPFAVAAAGPAPAFAQTKGPRRTVSAGGGATLETLPSHPGAFFGTPGRQGQPRASLLAVVVQSLSPDDPARCFFAACLVRRLLTYHASHAELVQRLDVLPRLLHVLTTCRQRATALQVLV